AYLLATRTDADCNVGYYGVGIEDLLGEASSITKPLVLHIAEEDGFVPKEAQAKAKDGLASTGAASIFSYPGMDHAFARIGGIPYDEENANLANGRTLDAFRAALS
ncbi:MAG: dienelactone hydrolase family protein, partial [Alphaproteobacteria bacterium]|nr:dienelactone hydrolase family protein [Alphaproteobacteria bacterium]